MRKWSQLLIYNSIRAWRSKIGHCWNIEDHYVWNSYPQHSGDEIQDVTFTFCFWGLVNLTLLHPVTDGSVVSLSGFQTCWTDREELHLQMSGLQLLNSHHWIRTKTSGSLWASHSTAEINEWLWTHTLTQTHTSLGLVHKARSWQSAEGQRLLLGNVDVRICS